MNTQRGTDFDSNERRENEALYCKRLHVLHFRISCEIGKCNIAGETISPNLVVE